MSQLWTVLFYVFLSWVCLHCSSAVAKAGKVYMDTSEDEDVKSVGFRVLITSVSLFGIALYLLFIAAQYVVYAFNHAY